MEDSSIKEINNIHYIKLDFNIDTCYDQITAYKILNNILNSYHSILDIDNTNSNKIIHISNTNSIVKFKPIIIIIKNKGLDKSLTLEIDNTIISIRHNNIANILSIKPSLTNTNINIIINVLKTAFNVYARYTKYSYNNIIYKRNNIIDIVKSNNACYLPAMNIYKKLIEDEKIRKSKVNKLILDLIDENKLILANTMMDTKNNYKVKKKIIHDKCTFKYGNVTREIHLTLLQVITYDNKQFKCTATALGYAILDPKDKHDKNIAIKISTNRANKLLNDINATATNSIFSLGLTYNRITAMHEYRLGVLESYKKLISNSGNTVIPALQRAVDKEYINEV